MGFEKHGKLWFYEPEGEKAEDILGFGKKKARIVKDQSGCDCSYTAKTAPGNVFLQGSNGDYYFKYRHNNVLYIRSITSLCCEAVDKVMEYDHPLTFIVVPKGELITLEIL